VDTNFLLLRSNLVHLPNMNQQALPNIPSVMTIKQFQLLYYIIETVQQRLN